MSIDPPRTLRQTPINVNQSVFLQNSLTAYRCGIQTEGHVSRTAPQAHATRDAYKNNIEV